MVSVGYTESSADKKASEIISSVGVKEELDALGFTEQNAKAVTAKILLNPKAADRDRLKAAEMAFKVHGTFQPEDTNDSNRPRVVNIFNNPTFEIATRTYEQSLKELISNAATQSIQPVQAQPADVDKHNE